MDKLKQTMTDKGCVGSVEFSDEDGVFFGKVQGVRSLISYEGERHAKHCKRIFGRRLMRISNCAKKSHENNASRKIERNFLVDKPINRCTFHAQLCKSDQLAKQMLLFPARN